jgi:membrane protein DedA with SNARE-associated domain
VLGAAVFEMRWTHFLMAIFAGRLLRFTFWSLLALVYGPQIVELAGNLFRRHFFWVLGAALLGLFSWWQVRRRSKIKKFEAPESSVPRDQV